jgi:galactan endo-1,6-beta-galactosidase
MHVPVLLATAVALAAADTTTTINPSTSWGTWDGWGTSLAWWAKKFGTRDDLADIFFTTKTTSFSGTSVPGLGFNIVRYNAGACSKNSINGESMVVSPKMMPSRQIEGYWTDWTSSDPSSPSWNWSADANQRAMMAKARARGATRFELFSNSPMWWMCKNHNPSGADDGKDNLQSWNQDQHAVYLATIAKYARDHWGVTFGTVEPFNEPVANWWNGRTGTQEGCHFDVATQAPVIAALRAELDSRGLSSTLVAASDENSYDQAVSTFNGLGSAALANLGQVNVHGYQEASGRRDTLYALASGKGKKLWNTEYGESDTTGRRLASNLLLDLRWLHPTAWVYWQVLDGGGWGLIDADNESGAVGAVAQKYFVLAQFTRHIREGMRILDGGGDNVVAAYDAAKQKLVVVAVNWGSGQYLNFDLAKFSKPSVSGARVLRWQTKIGSGDRYVAYSDTTVSGTKFWSWFDTDTVQTFEVPNVVL